LLITLLYANPHKAHPEAHSDKGSRSWDCHHGKGHKGYCPGKAYTINNSWWTDIPNRVSHGRFKVPPGHRPPPGMCRLWYPNVPPGHQPPAQECWKMRQRNGYIIYGDYGYDPRYDWNRSGNQMTLRDIPHVLLDILLDRIT